MKIGRQLFWAFTATTLAGIAVGLLGLANLDQIKTLEASIYRENIQASRALMNAQTAFLNMRIVGRDMVFSEDQAKAREFYQTLTNLDAQFTQHLREYREATGIDRRSGLDSQLFTRFGNAYRDYQNVLSDLYSLMVRRQFAEARIDLYGEGAKAAKVMAGEMENLVSINTQSSAAKIREGEQVVESATVATFVVLSLSVLFGVAAVLILTRNLAHPLVRTSELAGRLAQGDLSVRPSPKDRNRKDEVGDLARSVDAMAQVLASFVGTLKETGSQILESAHQLDTRASGTALAAARIAEASQEGQNLALDQAAGVTETTATVAQIAATIERFDRLIEDQAASVSQTTASLEEMASNIRSLAGRAENLGQAFGDLRTTSDVGKDKLYAVVGQIGDVAAQAARLAEANNAIKAIAAQTNLLSMNAAIEAAHAGDAGAGFAVVAAEIRTLAEQAARQSKDITREVKAMQNLTAQVTQDSEVAKQAFGAILAKVDDMGRFEAELTNALAEQDEGAKQILEATLQVSQVSAEVRQGSTEILDGSQAIHREMGVLLDLSRRLEASLNQMTAEGRNITAASAGVMGDATRNRELSSRLDSVVGFFHA